MERATLLRIGIAFAVCLLLGGPLRAASLTPSRSGLLRQVRGAESHGFTYLQTDQQVRDFVRRGLLVPLGGNDDYAVKSTVRLPYARPAVRLFVERLAAGYRAACGEQLVVTSLVRPRTQQPRNASPLSVHPTGMAMDLRVSWSGRCRGWLESALLDLEGNGLLEAAREYRPPHYHVVLFPDPYIAWLEAHGDDAPQVVSTPAEPLQYRVRSGDSLWTIARRHGTSVDELRLANGLRSTVIRPGQLLSIPAR